MDDNEAEYFARCFFVWGSGGYTYASHRTRITLFIGYNVYKYKIYPGLSNVFLLIFLVIFWRINESQLEIPSSLGVVASFPFKKSRYSAEQFQN